MSPIRCPARPAEGFTLIESLIAIAISAILLAMAVPSLRPLAESTRSRNLAAELQMALDLTRSEAVRRGADAVVTICRSAGSQQAAPQCSAAVAAPFAANDWAAGWIVFAKAPANTDPGQVQTGDIVVARQPAADAGRVRPIVLSGAAQQFYAYSGDGRRNGAPATMSFSVDVRDPAVSTRSAAERCVTVDLAGRASIYRPAAGCP